jgi:branched-chain amino acid transport system permease protein
VTIGEYDLGKIGRLAFRSVLPFLVAVPLLFGVEQVLSEAWAFVAIVAGINVILAVSLNVVNGFTGQFSIGHAGFMAVGAYTSAKITLAFSAVQIAGIPAAASDQIVFAFALACGMATAAVAGLVVGMPSLRLRGDYLAIVTLGFGEVIRVLANNLDKPVNITNGPRGITPIGRPPLPAGLDYSHFFYYLVLAIVVVVILVSRRLEDSHIGRGWEAIREDEVAAQAMGVPLVRMKLLAFACGASFAGVMGAVFSAKQVYINPESFTFLESIGVLAMVILGGMGSIPGVVVGAAAVTVLNLQILKSLSLTLNEWKNAGVTILGYNLANLPTQLEPAKYERAVFGIILVLMMIFRPQGILPARRRQRELSRLRKAAPDTAVPPAEVSGK